MESFGLFLQLSLEKKGNMFGINLQKSFDLYTGLVMIRQNGFKASFFFWHLMQLNVGYKDGLEVYSPSMRSQSKLSLSFAINNESIRTGGRRLYENHRDAFFIQVDTIVLKEARKKHFLFDGPTLVCRDLRHFMQNTVFNNTVRLVNFVRFEMIVVFEKLLCP